MSSEQFRIKTEDYLLRAWIGVMADGGVNKKLDLLHRESHASPPLLCDHNTKHPK